MFENWVLRIRKWNIMSHSLPTTYNLTSAAFVFAFLQPSWIWTFTEFNSSSSSMSPSSPVFLSDHSPPTVETCIWWIRRKPQQHKCSHVYAQTLREVRYDVNWLHYVKLLRLDGYIDTFTLLLVYTLQHSCLKYHFTALFITLRQ